jgi:protein TonB
VRVGGDVKPPELVSRREPVYPPLARQMHVQGTVSVEARIDRQGRVTEVVPLQGHPMLRTAAVEAVRHWTYRPATLNGQPVESASRVEVNFIAGK